MAKLQPYLHFDGTCREAMNFYKEVLGGEVEFKTVGESGMMDKWPTDMPKPDPEKIMHSALKKGEWSLMASDMMDPSSFKIGDNVDLCLVCESKEEIETLSKKLSEGGKIFMKLEEAPFGWFTQFTDKFGTEWMLQYSEDKK
jgi:PhnB protein